jgi:hypothetical protein
MIASSAIAHGLKSAFGFHEIRKPLSIFVLSYFLEATRFPLHLKILYLFVLPHDLIPKRLRLFGIMLSS